MRNYTLILIGLLFFLAPNISTAQDFGLFHSILDQLNEDQRKDFFGKINEIDSNSISGLDNDLGDGLDQSGVVDSLAKLVSGDNPLIDMDSLGFQWGEGRDYLSELIDSTNNDTLDVSGLLGEYDFINGAWNENLDSLGGIFDDFNDEISVINDLDVDDPPSQDFDTLYSYFNPDIDSTSPGGLGGVRFDNIVNRLFSRDMFTDLELAYGVRDADINFYSNPSMLLGKVQVVRIGSVPSFNSLWETRWHAAHSFTANTTSTLGDGSVVTTDVYQPLTGDFDYAVMYNPGFSFGSLTFRYISGLGIEAGLLAPSFADASSTRASSRRGNTFGYGPQVSTGFSLTQGDITTYAIAKATYGRVVCGPMLDHDYSSIKFEAGVRFAKAINIRYSIGEQSWTAELPNTTGKRISYGQQFTIGMIIDSLFK